MANADWPKEEQFGHNLLQKIDGSHAKIPRKRTNEGLVQSEAVIADNGLLPGTTKDYSGWDVYNNEAKKVDTELVKDWTASLNSLLLFAAIFAAVLTAFIIESKKMLEVSPTDALLQVMVFHIKNLANGTHESYVPPDFIPEPYAVTVNCLFFASLSVSLVAALASVIALQWVADYDAAITPGGSSPEDRAKRRQFRHAGVVWWKMADVIAALPMLLYLSVILFFTGLIMWMKVVHRTVGLVVTAGTTTAALFYGITTFLAVAFVSAPFRTPLSRWIYSLIHVPFSVGYLVARSLPVLPLPAWLESRHGRDASVHRRVDREVEKRSELGRDALVWLANQLSISQDSCDRLLLLVSELPKLDLNYVASGSFGKAPWFSIFDLLGWKYLQMDANTGTDVENARAFEILIQCARIPYIEDIIRPTGSMPYIRNDVQEVYWSQHCGTRRGRWSRGSGPNYLYLLLRDVPFFPEYSASDINAVIQVFLWRNSPEKDIIAWSKLLELAIASSEPVFRALTRTLCRFLIAQSSEWYRRNEAGCIEIFDRLLRYLADKTVEVDASTLSSLTMAFEHVITRRETKLTDFRVHYPHLYRRMLGYSSTRARSAHCSLTLLLGRNLHCYSGPLMSIQVKRILTMLWIQSSEPLTRDPADLKAMDVESWDPIAGAVELQDSETMEWIICADKQPYTLEILLRLSEAQLGQSKVGSLWRLSTHDTLHKGIFEALRTFDRIISQGVNPEQHFMLVTIICQDLELDSPWNASKCKYFINNEFCLKILEELHDPCLRLLAKSFAAPDSDRLYIPFPLTTGLWKRSWHRIAIHLMEYHKNSTSESLLRLKASLWPEIDNHESQLCKQASGRPEDLAHLRLIFNHPVPCPQHYDGTGHLLLHVFEHIERSQVRVGIVEFALIPMFGFSFDVLLLILALRKQDHEQLRSDDIEVQLDGQCLEHLLEICSVVKESQFSLLSLLCDLLVKLTDKDGLAVEDVKLVSMCVENALLLPEDTKTISIIPLLTLRIGRLRDRLLQIADGDEEESDIARNGANRSINDLMNRFACMSVFGGQNNRILSCAQTHGTHSPAVGWLSIHMD